VIRFKHILPGILLLICGAITLCDNLKNSSKAAYKAESISAYTDSYPIPDSKNPVPELSKTRFSQYFSIELPESLISVGGFSKIFRCHIHAGKLLLNPDPRIYENFGAARILQILVVPNAP